MLAMILSSCSKVVFSASGDFSKDDGFILQPFPKEKVETLKVKVNGQDAIVTTTSRTLDMGVFVNILNKKCKPIQQVIKMVT